MARCDQPHPEDPARTCRKAPSPEHGLHLDREGSWPNPDYVAPEGVRVSARRRQGARANQMELTSFLGQHRSSGQSSEPHTGVPPEAAEKWDATPWVAEAKKIVVEWLRTHPEQFTTAEDWWPLLVKPEEMRAMTRVVQQCLRAGFMEEVSSKRLSEVYRTADGHQFSENKLVPVYRSRICARS